MQRGGISKWDIIHGNREVSDKARERLKLPVFNISGTVKGFIANSTKQRKKIIGLYTKLLNTTTHECTYCGDDIDSRDSFLYTIDHIVAQALGGANVIENLRPCCRECNLEKGELTIDEWLNILYREYDNSEGLNSLLLYKIMRVQLIKRYVDRMGKLLYK